MASAVHSIQRSRYKALIRSLCARHEAGHGGQDGRHDRWLAPLERTCEEIFAAGFLIERLWEPRPQPEAAAIDGPEYELLSREPRGFMAFRLISPT